MVKTKKSKVKKRKSQEITTTTLDSLCNIAGLGTNEEYGELAGCLAEFDVPPSNSNNNDDDDDKTNDNDNDNGETTTTDNNNVTSKLQKSTTKRIIKPPPPPPPDLTKEVPDVRIELSRHYQMGQLSSYFLKSCPNLRMPSFERWLFDSKLEERTKRRCWMEGLSSSGGAKKKKKKKRKPRRRDNRDNEEEEEENENNAPPVGLEYDPVIPTYPNVNDEASQRLLFEIQESKYHKNDNHTTHNKKKKVEQEEEEEQDAVYIMEQLCSKSINAAREVSNLSSRVGRNPFLLQSSLSFSSSSSSFKKKKSKNTCNERIVLETSNDDESTTTTAEDKNMYTLLYQRKSKENTTTDDNDSNNNNEDTNDTAAATTAATTTSKAYKTIFLVKINKSHYEKLRTMFNLVHGHNNNNNNNHLSYTTQNSLHVPSPTSSSKKKMNKAIIHTFHSILFCLILRYSSISGGFLIQDLKGGGMQGAIHSFVFEILEDYFGLLDDGGGGGGSAKEGEVKVGECFASPLNVNQGFYYSAFGGSGGGGDSLDRHFGSKGDFFDIKLGNLGIHNNTNGEQKRITCLEANPPFVPGLMNEMVSKMEEYLNYADEHDEDLIFAIIVPTYQRYQGRTYHDNDEGDDTTTSTNSTVQKYASKSFTRMIKSAHFAHHVVLKSREHGYIEGSQHLRPTKYKTSQYDTSLIVLMSQSLMDQNKKKEGSKKFNWDKFEQDVRNAFASRHEDELEARQGERENKKRRV